MEPRAARRGASGVVSRLRVRYADTDCMGVAYYANYLTWFEVGRNEYMRAKGSPYKQLEQLSIRMPVTEAQCRYRSSARYDDLLEVETVLEVLGYVKLRFDYQVRRAEDRKLLATGYTWHAALGGDGRPRRIPEDLRACLAS